MGVRGKGAAKREETVALAIDKDKGSQYAIKWTVDNLLSRGQALTLLHVKQSAFPNHAAEGIEEAAKVARNHEALARELFLPFRCYCTKKAIRCNEVIVEDSDISRALINYATANMIEVMVLGTPSKNGLIRFMTTDIPSIVSKKAPDFSTVYVIGRGGKISHVRPATSAVAQKAPTLPNQTEHRPSNVSESNDAQMMIVNYKPIAPERRQYPSVRTRYPPRPDEEEIIERPSMDRMFPSIYDSMSSGRPSINSEFDSRSSTSTPSYSGTKFIDMGSPFCEFSSSSFESGNSWSSSPSVDDVEAEMRRLRLELKQTRDMYTTACREAVTARNKAKEVNQWKLEEEMKLEEARLAEEAAMELVEREKAKCKAAIEAAEAAQRFAEMEAQKRRNAELNAVREAAQRKKALEGRSYDLRYRRYSIEEIEVATNSFKDGYKIGEGGYGPVFRGELDHTPVAIKVLRPDAAQGQSQFKQEVEVLSCIRHPNMVLLLGACPEYGCLVYEYMANGSLEDRLFRRGNTPVIPWQLRFRIAAEIATGLLFLHQTKPEPIVHRDLKPGNILLDRNYVSKISDVGLARLVPPSVANSVTQYRMTSTAGTFCYIDPEYQQTGMLGVKSDVYSFGIMLLQMITARPPMGLTHHVEEAIEAGSFVEMLDPAVSDWPVEETLDFAKIALQCAEMRRKDRPDLGAIVLTELNRLRELAQDSMNRVMFGGAGEVYPAKQGPVLVREDEISDSNLTHSGYDSSRSQSSTSSYPGK